jgi:DNA-directed RNA polymerase specialized sigma24 family protein
VNKVGGEVAMDQGRLGRGRPTALADRDEMVDALFRRHCAGLVRLAMVLLGDRAEAEEVVQDAFVSLHRHWSTLRGQNAAGAYLRGAVVRGCRSRQRRFVRSRAMTMRLAVVPADGNLEDVQSEWTRRHESPRPSAPCRRGSARSSSRALPRADREPDRAAARHRRRVRQTARSPCPGRASARNRGDLMSLDERQVIEAVSSYAEGVVMTSTDLDRMQHDLHRRLRQPHRPQARWVVAVAAALLLIAAIVGGAWWLRKPAAPFPPTRQGSGPFP